MADDEKPVSLSGAPIYQHEAPEDGHHGVAPEGRFLEEISDHIERHLGPIEMVFHELQSEFVHVDVHWVPPNEKRPFHTLVSSGMSDLPMAVPDGVDAPRFAELQITLPPHWQVSQQAFQDEACYWPVRLLKMMARMPHVYDTWLGIGHTVPNGDPPAPYDDSTALCGALVLSSPQVPEDFLTLHAGSGEEIVFYAVVPLHADEMEYKLRRGMDALLPRFDKADVSDVVDPARASVCKRRWNPFR